MVETITIVGYQWWLLKGQYAIVTHQFQSVLSAIYGYMIDYAFVTGSKFLEIMDRLSWSTKRCNFGIGFIPNSIGSSIDCSVIIYL